MNYPFFPFVPFIGQHRHCGPSILEFMAFLPRHSHCDRDFGFHFGHHHGWYGHRYW